VIDYKTQQSRLFPLLASAYAFRFVGEWLKWLYTDVTQRLQANDFSTLPEAHACTAGLKSLTTSATADGIEECRKLCGGHGYLCSSGLPELFAVYIPACTYEGDNIVLLLQVCQNELSIPYFFLLLFHIKCKYIVELWAIQCALLVCFGSEEDLLLNI